MRKAQDRLEEKVISDISTYGVHIVHVLEEGEYPGFSFTVGLFESCLHPEIIIIGLEREVSHVLLNNLAHDIKRGKSYSAGDYHEGVLDDFLCYFGEVPKSHYKEYMGWALWFYEGDEFPLVQCIPPTVEGKFPWDRDFPSDAEFFLQVIAKIPKEH